MRINRLSASALVAVFILSVILAVGIVRVIPASYATSSQTYYLDSAIGSGGTADVCDFISSLDYSTAPSSASNVTISTTAPDNAVDFCEPSIPASITSQDATLVLFVASSSSSISIQEFLADITTSTPILYSSSTNSVSGTTCSSPTEITLDLTASPASGFLSGDTIELAIGNIGSSSFTVCTGGSYASYVTINTVATTSVPEFPIASLSSLLLIALLLPVLLLARRKFRAIARSPLV